jgi:hypothetical protein
MWERFLDLSARYPLDLIAHLSGLLPILTGLIRFRQLNRVGLWIWLLFIFFFTKDSYSLWLVLLARSTTFVQNVEAFFQVIFISQIFYWSFESKKSKQITIGVLLLALAGIAYTYSSSNVSTMSMTIVRVVSIGFSLAYFNKVLVDMRIKNILLHSMFWFCAGLLVYASGTFFSMLFSEYWYGDIAKVPAEIFDRYWNICQTLFIVFCCIAAIGLWVSKHDQENFVDTIRKNQQVLL